MAVTASKKCRRVAGGWPATNSMMAAHSRKVPQYTIRTGQLSSLSVVGLSRWGGSAVTDGAPCPAGGGSQGCCEGGSGEGVVAAPRRWMAWRSGWPAATGGGRERGTWHAIKSAALWTRLLGKLAQLERTCKAVLAAWRHVDIEIGKGAAEGEASQGLWPTAATRQAAA